MKLDANDRTVRQVLNGNFFTIPRFQRPYEWTLDNVEELWEDAVQESDGEYFIGSMVVYPASGDTMVVIDGQQRLTTLQMLLATIRDAAEKLGDESLANGTHIFIERKDENDVDRFVLKTESSFPYLHDEILSRGQPELNAKVGSEERAIKAAFDRLTEYVGATVDNVLNDPTMKEETKKEAAVGALKQVRDKLLDLKLIFVEVGTEIEATTIFVTLNSRGKDLEPAALIKAHLLQMLPQKGGLDRPLEKWDGIVEKFDESQAQLTMTPFLHSVWRSRYGNATEKSLVKEFRKKIKKPQAAEFLNEVVADAELWRQVNEPEYRKWAKEHRDAADSLRFFREFQIRQPMPLLLSLMREFDAGRISIKQLHRALRAIEDYHFTYNVLASKTSYGGMSLFYAKRARELLDAVDDNARKLVIDDLVDELKAKRPTDPEFDEAFGELWYTDQVTADKRVIQYVLRRFYQHADPKTAIDFSSMTIEHLAPQSDGSEKVGKLGNLIYVTETLNGQLEDRPFEEKQEILKGIGTQWIPDDVKDADGWDEEDIEERTKALAELARKEVWKG
jgi:hypothetical protein